MPPTRRAFLASVAAIPLPLLAKVEQVYPADRKRYSDPTTEFEVLRLTDPAYESCLPFCQNRPVSRKGGFLIYASDRSGSMQAMRMDLKSGESAALTSAASLRPSSVTLMPDERSLCYLDGSSLIISGISTGKLRKFYNLTADTECGGFSVSEDGGHVFLVELKGQSSRLRLISLLRGSAETVLEASGRILDPLPRPWRSGILYRREDGTLWLVNYDGQQNRKLRVAPGNVVKAIWSPDGRTVLYLSVQEQPQRKHVLRESTPDTNADQQIAPTTQFADFGRNADASVFVGASGSVAQPHILLLVRSVKREFTLCEHKSKNMAVVSVQFAPDNRRIYFQTDRHGKPAIYSMAVDRLVEASQSE
jgi:oligogalacturonide lyase